MTFLPVVYLMAFSQRPPHNAIAVHLTSIPDDNPTYVSPTVSLPITIIGSLHTPDTSSSAIISDFILSQNDEEPYLQSILLVITTSIINCSILAKRGWFCSKSSDQISHSMVSYL
jgi:hypothetical protein